MALYLIGDVQGCQAAFERLLQTVDFSPSQDTLYLLGDLVNRGPDALPLLERLAGLGPSVQCVLGNHDLHLLAQAAGVGQSPNAHALRDALKAPHHQALVEWLRHRPMALQAHGWLMVHAGVLPAWTTAQTMALAQEVEQALRGPQFATFLAGMYGNTPNAWRDDLAGLDRLRVVVNAFTRLRFCTASGTMEFSAAGVLETAPPGYMPWFEVPGRQTANTRVAFGHWSALNPDAPETLPTMRHNTLGLDTGCVWGRCLTAARLGAQAGEFELVSVDCPK